jgi:hypothetical protein
LVVPESWCNNVGQQENLQKDHYRSLKKVLTITLLIPGPMKQLQWYLHKMVTLIIQLGSNPCATNIGQLEKGFSAFWAQFEEIIGGFSSWHIYIII